MDGMRVHLIDTNGLISRYWHANPQYGAMNFTNFLLRFPRQEGDLIICVFDSPSSRSAKKSAVRKEKPEELKALLANGPEMVSNLGFNVWKQDGYEGDQLIGHFVHARAHDFEIEFSIYSDDKDFVQLLALPNVTLFKDLGRMKFTRADAERRYGFPPEYMADYLALGGDANDGIKAIKGFGDKGAKKLIEQFHAPRVFPMHTEKASVVLFLLSIPDSVLKNLLALKEAYNETRLKKEDIRIPDFKPSSGVSDPMELIAMGGMDLELPD